MNSRAQPRANTRARSQKPDRPAWPFGEQSPRRGHLVEGTTAIDGPRKVILSISNTPSRSLALTNLSAVVAGILKVLIWMVAIGIAVTAAIFVATAGILARSVTRRRRR